MKAATRESCEAPAVMHPHTSYAEWRCIRRFAASSSAHFWSRIPSGANCEKLRDRGAAGR